MTNIEIPEPAASIVDIINRHDEEGFFSALTEDAVVDDWGRTFTGHDEITSWSDREFFGSRGALTVEEVKQDGDDVTVVGDWRSSYANGRSAFTFHMAGEKLSRMTIREG